MNKPSSSKVIAGVLHVHPRGFAFLQPDDTVNYPQDVFIPKHLTRRAVDGDRVEVRVEKETSKGPEGVVVTILQRSRSHIAGTVLKLLNPHEALVYAPLLGATKRVLVHCEEANKMQEGDRLILKVIEWSDAQGAIRTLHVNWIGNIHTPLSDIPAAIEEFELRSSFPHNAIQEATAFGKSVRKADLKDRLDLREVECFTIDPDTAKDFDDALSLHPLKNGGWELGVHIADVSFYVTHQSALDVEARARANSTYFPGYCLPMLPKELSENLCSLKPKVDRLTVSVLMQFDKEGKLLKEKICRSVIHSAKRFTYKEAKAVLDGKKRSKHSQTLQAMVALCHLLKKERAKRGSVEFSLPETVIHIDPQGAPTHLERIDYDITHQMVEEFMLKANEVVATHLSRLGKPLTYRVHEAPAVESLNTFSSLARAFGFHLPKEPSPQDFQSLFEKAADSPYFSQLAVSFIRSMKLAFYSTTNGGHYGLSLAYYSHFTSPIRRYIDLVVHRILLGDSTELDQLNAIAYHCSERERISARAEQSVILLKKFRLLSQSFEEDPSLFYPAMVTRVKSGGILFELQGWALEGFLPIHQLSDQFLTFNEKQLSLSSDSGTVCFKCGSTLSVRPTRLNLITLESEWEVERTEKKSIRKKSSAKKKRKKT